VGQAGSGPLMSNGRRRMAARSAKMSAVSVKSFKEPTDER
jgi:hypothetical protein